MIPLMLLVALASPLDDERGGRITHGLIGAYIVASSMDLATTMHCLGAQTCHEANPLLAPLDHRPIAFAGAKTGVAVSVALILIKQHQRHPKLVRLVAVGLTASSVAIAIRNTRHR